MLEDDLGSLPSQVGGVDHPLHDRRLRQAARSRGVRLDTLRGRAQPPSRRGLHGKETPEPVDEGPRFRSCGIQYWTLHRFVQSKSRRILPREPREKLRLPLVDVPERSTLASGLASATLSQFVQNARIVRNQLDQKILQHPGEPVVRHDPDAEPREAGVDDLQAIGRNLVRQLRKLTATPSPELIPAGRGVTVSIDHDPRASSSVALNSAAMTSGLRIPSTLPHASMNTGELGGSGHGTPFASIRYGITFLSVSPSTSSFFG